MYFIQMNKCNCQLLPIDKQSNPPCPEFFPWFLTHNLDYFMEHAKYVCCYYLKTLNTLYRAVRSFFLFFTQSLLHSLHFPTYLINKLKTISFSLFFPLPSVSFLSSQMFNLIRSNIIFFQSTF